MATAVIVNTVDQLLELCSHPYLQAALALANAAKTFIHGDSVQTAVRIVADSKLKSIEKAMAEIPQKRDVRSAAEVILMQLTEAYFLFSEYYQKMPQGMEVQIPGLWEFNEIHMSVRGTAEIKDTIARICFLTAVYHKALGDDAALVREWLCEKAFPCDRYEILEGLLGRDAALEYIASHPDAGRRIAGQYLTERDVSLADYRTPLTV